MGDLCQDHLQFNKQKTHVAARLEDARNGVERIFVVLEACLAVVCGPTKQWDLEDTMESDDLFV